MSDTWVFFAKRKSVKPSFSFFLNVHHYYLVDNWLQLLTLHFYSVHPTPWLKKELFTSVLIFVKKCFVTKSKYQNWNVHLVNHMHLLALYAKWYFFLSDMIRMPIRHDWYVIKTSLFQKFWMNQISLHRCLLLNLCVHSKFTRLKVTKGKIRVSLSKIFAIDVKQFHTNWYRQPGELIDPWSQLDVPNGCNIKKKTCTSRFDEGTGYL